MHAWPFYKPSPGVYSWDIVLVFYVYPACISHKSQYPWYYIPLYPCTDLYLAILYPAAVSHCFHLYPYFSSCI